MKTSVGESLSLPLFHQPQLRKRHFFERLRFPSLLLLFPSFPLLPSDLLQTLPTTLLNASFESLD